MGLVAGGEGHRIPVEPGSTSFSWFFILSARDLPCQVEGGIVSLHSDPKAMRRIEETKCDAWPPISWKPGTVLYEVQAGFRGCVDDDQVLSGVQAKGFSGI